jgi:hypothetical protein
MQNKPHSLVSLIQAGVCAIFAFGIVAQIQAADPAGTWTWTSAGRQGGPERKMSLKLKVEGEKLTGTLTSPGVRGNRRHGNRDGKVKGDETVHRDARVRRNKMTSKYTAVSADAIKGD